MKLNPPFAAYDGDEPYIFVSYARKDLEIVYPEMERLRSLGYNVWYDDGIQPGATWREEVALALTESKLLLYFVTPASVSSQNCQQELNFGLSRERQVLAVHLVDTVLSMGIELSLGNKQAIMKYRLSEEIYVDKLANALRTLMKLAPANLPARPVMKTAPLQSIAVLPFSNQSSDPENQYLCNGITDEMISGLAKVKGLKVASQLACLGLSGQHLAPGAIGASLNVANVLTGSIQKAGDRVRIISTLIEVQDGSVLWSERYDGKLEDVFDLQEEVANKVIAALKLELGTGTGAPTIDSGTTDVAAYQSFLLGMHEFKKLSRRGLLKAHQHFADAVEADPAFGRAYWYDFWVSIMERGRGFVPHREFYKPAIQLLDNMNRTKFKPPMPAIWIQRSLDPRTTPDMKTRAQESLDKIREGDTDWHGFQYSQLSVCLQAAGLLNGAHDFLAYYLDNTASFSLDTNLYATYGNLLFALGRFEKAIDHFSSVIRQDPGDVYSLGTRAMLYSRTGQYAKADADIGELSKAFPRNFTQFYQAYWLRDTEKAAELLEWMKGQRNLLPFFRIWGHFLMGEIGPGMDYLEQAKIPADGLRTQVLFALTPSIVRTVTAHPRYQALLKQQGMDDAWRDELMIRTNALESITGIRVALDEDY